METSPDKLTGIESRQAIEDLNGDFCHFLDCNMIEELVDLFTEDARYSHGSRVSCGREQIHRLFVDRTAQRPRTSRHLQTGLRITLQAPDSAVGRSVCLTFASDGPPPISPATPLLVADFIDEYHRGTDGRWRISKRHIERIFTASGNTRPVGDGATSQS
jgi:ketosteroid isomerase-like protein